jgi:hypothetical protein
MMRRVSFALVLVALAQAGGAAATETQWWTSDTQADYGKAEARGVVVRADGALEGGPAAVSFAADSLRTVWAVAVLADGSVALAGDRGRIDRWTAAGGVKPWVRLGAGQVLCLARDGDGLLAGTGPNGLVYRVSARGDTTLAVKTGERYVWAIVPAGGDAFWAATGTLGKLLRVEGGRARTVFDSEESNLVCLIDDGHGGVVSGGDSQGRVYEVTAAGRVSTLFDSAEDEIRALARGADGSLWAAALSLSAVNTDAGDDDEHPAPARGPVIPGKATIYRLVPDSSTVAWWVSPQPLIHALAATAAGPLAATGNRAGLFRIERLNGAAQLLAPAQAQVTALATSPDGTIWAATSNPATLWKVGPDRAKDGELLSAALDARRFARFGRLRWHGRGDARFATRSGNCESPDTTWSAWAPVPAGDDGGRIASPGARYLQWKVTVGAGETRVDEVAIAWREPNLAPRIDDITVTPQGQGFREGEMGVRSEAITQALPGGQKVEYSATLLGGKPLREMPVWARGLRTLQWHASDPNGDALKFRVQIRNEAGGEWIEIGKDLEAALFTWNTNTLPDGRYRLRVTASDGGANPLGEERTGESLSEPFAIDNTAPVFAELSGDGARVRGRAEDASSPVARLDVAVDDGEWRTVSGESGFGDARTAPFAFQLPGLAAGEHLVSVRAVDMAGNAVTRALTIRVAATR